MKRYRMNDETVQHPVRVIRILPVACRAQTVDIVPGQHTQRTPSALLVRRGADLPALDDARRIAELERKIGQLAMENDFLKKALQHFKDHHPPAVVSGADVCLKKSGAPRKKAKP